MGWQDDPVVGAPPTARPAKRREDMGAARNQFAEAASAATGVPKSAILAQTALETGHDGAKTVGAYNFGNIKGSGSAGAASANTTEYRGGRATTERAAFRQYNSPEEAAQDYVRLLLKKYPEAANARSPEEFAAALQKGGYATDPAYAKKVTATAQRYKGADAKPWEQDEVVAPERQVATNEPALPPPPANAGVIKNIGAGLVAGAGEIGSTILAPIDWAARKLGVQNEFIGRTDRRQAIENALSDQFGADTNSTAYGVGKVGAEVAGTAGVGGAIAKAGRAIPLLANSATAANVLRAAETGGLQGGGLVTRTLGGSVAGAASAGLVDPSQAGTGAVIGAVAPTVINKLGQAGSALAAKTQRTVNPQVMSAAKDANKLGYVIPPSDIQQQGVVMEALGGLSGKIKTAQEASVRNQQVTNKLVRQSLGLADDAPLTRETLAGIRQQAGQAYEPLRAAGEIVADQKYLDALDKIAAQTNGAAKSFPGLKSDQVEQMVNQLKQPKFDGADAVDAIRALRDMADGAYAKGEKATGKAMKQASQALEDAMERHLQQSGQQEALDAYRNARKLIAKTYTVEKGLNGETGDVSAQTLASMLKRGKPLSGELETIARVGEAFPKATQALKEAPKAVSPLDWVAGGGVSAATGNPLLGVAMLSRPVVRSALLSKPVQSLALRPGGQGIVNRGANALADPMAQLYLSRVAPNLLRADQ